LANGYSITHLDLPQIQFLFFEDDELLWRFLGYIQVTTAIFAHKAKANGVIFLRYKVQHFFDITDSLIKVLNTAGDLLYGKFVVITVKKVRMREI